jgi:hypothetical protein
LEKHDKTEGAWRLLGEELDWFGFRDVPNERRAPKEAAMVAVAALLNQFVARYSLPGVPDGLDMFVNDHDQFVAEFYGEDEEVPKRPDPEPQDWYLYIANAMGLTHHEDWPEIDAVIRLIIKVGRGVLDYSLIFDEEPSHILHARLLCDLAGLALDCAASPSQRGDHGRPGRKRSWPS